MKKRITKRWTTAARVAAVATCCGILSGCGVQEKSSAGEWKFAIEEIQGSVQHHYAERFKELVEAKTDGKVTVNVYPYGSLGTSQQITQLVKNGAVQLAMASPGHLGKTIPEVQAFLLHYVFSADPKVNRDVLRYGGKVQGLFEPLYAEKGFQLLDFFQEGWMVWTTDRKIETPEDMKGLKMRVMSSPLLVDTYKSYGANPTPMPYSEVYSGLQLGMIDGQVNPVFAIEEMSFFEVTDYMIFPNQVPFVASFIANRDFYAQLPEDQKQAVASAIRELETYIFEVQQRLNEERLATIEEKRPDLTLLHLTEEQREAFRAHSLSVRQAFVEREGQCQAVLDAILEETRRIEKSATPSANDAEAG